MFTQAIRNHPNQFFRRAACSAALLALASVLVACENPPPRPPGGAPPATSGTAPAPSSSVPVEVRPYVPPIVNVGMRDIPFQSACTKVKVSVTVEQSTPSGKKTLQSSGEITSQNASFQQTNGQSIDFAQPVKMCVRIDELQGYCPFVSVGQTWCFEGILERGAGVAELYRIWSEFKRQP